MKFPKITKLLPLVLALAMTTSCAFADEAGGEGGGAAPVADSISNSGSAVYNLTLAPFFDIDVNQAGGTSLTSFGSDYDSIEIKTALTGEFEVVSNEDRKTIYLVGTCGVEGNAKQPALYGAPGSLNIVFANTATLPAASDVETLVAGNNQVTKTNANAIAFALQDTYKSEECLKGKEDTLETAASLDTDTGVITYGIYNGKHTFTYTVEATGSVDNSFSTVDTDGTYTATLLMTDVLSQ